jgi:glutamyl-tRNA synthetase
MTVRTRFAPSPTGFLHIGGVRTALFSWLYARHHGGEFVLRIEDTDRERSTQAAVDAILHGLEWLGLGWEHGPYYQMRRLDRYQAEARRLLASGDAYHCYCTRDELDAMRAEQQARGEKPRYDGRCRDRTAPRPGVEPVVRFRTPRAGTIVVDDLVRGRVEFANAEFDDLVLLRPDGVPTFHFGVVVDDAEMGITHVIRGDDHLNNTPRQMHILAALGAPVPAYGHLPMILGADGAKLSKRHGAVNVLEYRDQGFLPEALLNYLVRLGWASGDREVFTVAEMIALFDIDAVNPSAARFDADKLRWINQQHLRAADPERLGRELAPHYAAAGVDVAGGPPLAGVAAAYRERATTLTEIVDASRFLYAAEPVRDAAAWRKHLVPAVRGPLADTLERLRALPVWDREALHGAVSDAATAAGIGFGKLGQPLRVAVTGGTVSPPIDVTLGLVGRERTLARIAAALAAIDADGQQGGLP